MKNNKVGILTFHNVINYGGMLQAYALNNYINKNICYCETLNYDCKKIKKSYKLIKLSFLDINIMLNSFLNFGNNLIKFIKFRNFLNNNIVLSSCKYNFKNIKNANNYYDTFIVGSDQIWNYNITNDWNYYLSFVENPNVKCSYSASFGNISVIDNYYSIIKEYLNDFKFLSVREKSGVNIINNKFGLNCRNVVDPTFLLNESDWNLLIKNNIKEDYILLYVLHENDCYKIADRIKKLTGLKVYVISQSIRKKIDGKYFRNAGPIEFLTLIKNCKYIITDSFHGTAFGIIFKKNLKVVLKNENKHLNDRLISIIDLFAIENCIVNIDSSDSSLLSITEYDTDKINSIINHSKEYLNNILNK